ncbi:MAG: hypothetical protein GXO77_14245 [Calditrichaeota bacterium]|nr:hypothetical protein [Calditrichota bacterium]
MFTIVSALKAEIDPVLRFLGHPQRTPVDKGTLYACQELHLLRMGISSETASSTLKAYLKTCKPQFIISVGFAGSLSPHIKPGAVFRIQSVVSAENGRSVNLSLKPEFSGLPEAKLLTVSRALKDQSERENLFRRFNAQLVDMESYHLAELCSGASLPFYILKCVTDNSSEQTDREFRRNFRNCALKLFEALKPLIVEFQSGKK